MCDGRFITNEWWYERAGKVSRQKVKKWLKKIKGSYDLTFFRKSKGPEGPDECSYCPLLFAWIVEGFFFRRKEKKMFAISVMSSKLPAAEIVWGTSSAQYVDFCAQKGAFW